MSEIHLNLFHSRTSVARTLMTRLPCMTRTCFSMVPYMKLPWSIFCIFVFHAVTKINQSAEGAGGLGIIRSNKVGETE